MKFRLQTWLEQGSYSKSQALQRPAYPSFEIESSQKFDFRPDRTHESHPTAWELSRQDTWRVIFRKHFS